LVVGFASTNTNKLFSTPKLDITPTIATPTKTTPTTTQHLLSKNKARDLSGSLVFYQAAEVPPLKYLCTYFLQKYLPQYHSQWEKKLRSIPHDTQHEILRELDDFHWLLNSN